MEEEKWTIDNDEKAEWALKKIREETEEHDRLMKLAAAEQEKLTARIAEINKAYEDGTSWLKYQLSQYFETVPHKATKTTEKYALLSGTLVRKKGGIEYKRDDGAVLTWLNENRLDQFIKTKLDVDWKELKTRTSITEDGMVVFDDTGEIIDGIKAEQKPDTFDIVF